MNKDDEEELKKFSEWVDEVNAEKKLKEQEEEALDATKFLNELNSVLQLCQSKVLQMKDFAVWVAAREAIEKNRYGLSTSECLAIGKNLINTNAFGLKMAGIELAAHSTQYKLNCASNKSKNSFSIIFDQRIDDDSPEFTLAEDLVSEFLKSVQSLVNSVGDLPMVSPSEEVISAITSAKTACTKREIDSWRSGHLRDLGKRYCAESDELMKNVNAHAAIDTAIDEICDEHRSKFSGELNGSIPFSQSVCLFAFGMSLEFSKRSKIENAPQWTLPRTVASAASSLISQGVHNSAVTYYKLVFFNVVFDEHEASSTDSSRLWIQAGATAMDRFCRTDSDQFLEDFRNATLIFAKNSS